MPTAPKHSHRRSSIANRAKAVWQCTTGVPLPTAPKQRSPLPPSSAALCRTSSTSHCPRVVRKSSVGVPMPAAPRSEAVHRKNSTTHCPGAVR